MRHIIIFKLTRMGDIVEASPLVQCIRAQEPDAHITLVINEAFRTTAELLEDVDEIIGYPITATAEELRTGCRDLVTHYTGLEAFADALSTRCYDLAINATNSKLSGLLMGFVRAQSFRGLRYEDDGARVTSGAFLRYFAPNEGMRRTCPFNLSDFIRALYATPGYPITGALSLKREVKDRARALLGDAPPLRVGLQLGASESSKRWHLSAFSTLALELIDQGVSSIVLLGAADEMPLGNAFLERLSGQAAHVHNLIGRTQVDELAACLETLDLLISNDTGTMHLAAAVGTTVINLSLGSAWFRETAPYGEGHLILEPRTPCRPCAFSFECEHFQCKKEMNPAAVARLAIAMLKNAPLPLPPDIPFDVYRTSFDPDGHLDYIRLTPRPSKPDEVMNLIFRIVIAQEELGGDFDKRLAWMIQRLQAESPGLERDCIDLLRKNADDCIHLYHLALDGIATSDHALEALNSADALRIRYLLERLGEVDRETSRAGEDNPFLRLLTRGHLLLKESIRGTRLDLLLTAHRMASVGLRTSALHCHRAIELVVKTFENAPRVTGTDPVDPLPLNDHRCRLNPAGPL